MSWPRFHALPYQADAGGYFACLRDLPWPVWLDSGRPALSSGRYDILAADPAETLVIGAATAPDAAQDALRELLGTPQRAVPDLPFAGGLIGFASYELGRQWQGLQAAAGPRLADDLRAGLYDWALVIDHQRQTATLVGAGRAQQTRDRWDALLQRLAGVSDAQAATQPAAELLSLGLDETAYAQGFERIQHYIREGDIYQVNFTRRLQARSHEDAWSLYRRLRTLSPAPYGAFLDYGDYQVLSNSPEQFVSLADGRVQTRPIKGTRPRGHTPQEDARLRADLGASDKDRAENLMIVDLLRNDLGRVCEPGSIEVPQLFGIESYATVHHLVSTVTGRLAAGRDAIDLLQACFPGGSITGAPKRRAMQIIDELEPVSRELYCGSVFRLGFDGNLDSSISIRTALKSGEELFYWAGGGIVADSQCEAEYQESLDKAAAFFRLLGITPPRAGV